MSGNPNRPPQVNPSLAAATLIASRNGMDGSQLSAQLAGLGTAPAQKPSTQERTQAVKMLQDALRGKMTPQNVAQLEGTLYQKAGDRAAYAYQLQSILQRASSGVNQTSASTSASQQLNIQLQSGARPAIQLLQGKINAQQHAPGAIPLNIAGALRGAAAAVNNRPTQISIGRPTTAQNIQVNATQIQNLLTGSNRILQGGIAQVSAGPGAQVQLTPAMASFPISRPSVQTLAPGRPVSVVQSSNFGIVPQTVSTNANATLPWLQNFLSTGKFPDANAAMAALRNQQRGLQVPAQLQGGGTVRPGTQPGFPIRSQGTQLTSAQIVMQPATQGQSTSGTSSNVKILTDSQKAGTRELMEQLMRDKFLGSIKKLAGAAEQTNGINQHLKAYLPKLLNIISVLETQQAYILQNRDEWLFTPEDIKKVRTNLEKWAFQTTKELKNLGVNLTGLASLGVAATANPPAGSIPPNAFRPNNISAPTMNNIQRSNIQSTANQLLAQMQASVNRMGTQQRRNPIGGTIGYPPQDEIPAIKPVTAAQQSRVAPKRAPAKSAPKQPFPTSQPVTSVPIEISDSPPHDSDPMNADTPVESTVVTPSATETKPFAPPAPDPALAYMIEHVDVVDPFAGVAAMVREFEHSLDKAPGMDWGWVEVDEEFPDVEDDDESDDEDVNKMWVDVDPQAYVIEQVLKKGAKAADTKGKRTALTEGNKVVAI